MIAYLSPKWVIMNLCSWLSVQTEWWDVKSGSKHNLLSWFPNSGVWHFLFVFWLVAIKSENSLSSLLYVLVSVAHLDPRREILLTGKQCKCPTKQKTIWRGEAQNKTYLTASNKPSLQNAAHSLFRNIDHISCSYCSVLCTWQLEPLWYFSGISLDWPLCLRRKLSFLMTVGSTGHCWQWIVFRIFRC